MGAKQRQDQGTDRGTREEYRVDKAPVHGMGRVSHAERTERRAEREEAREDDSEEDEPMEIPLSAVTMHPKGTPAPASSVKAQVFEERVGPEQRHDWVANCLLYTSPSPRDRTRARMPSSA